MTYASHADTERIFQALLELQAKSPAAQMKLCVPAVAYKNLHIAQREGRLYVVGDFAVLVDVGAPWHTDKPVLIEEIIIRFQRVHGNKVEEAIAFLTDIARLHCCVAIAAGDTQIGLMAPRYEAAGFTSLGSQFYKEIV